MRKIGWKLCLGVLALLLTGIMLWFHRGAEPHSVTLTWQAPPPRKGVTVVWYNVYRRTVESQSFVKIAVRVPAPSYEDRLVISGRKYVYVVTAVDQVGRESRFSAETGAQIP
jgi:fibronectin type 3 domain-containing protein